MSALVNLVPTETAVGNPTLNIAIFIVFVLITLAIVIKVSRGNKGAAEYYTGGRAFTGRQNGIAIAGDYLSAASFLGIAGAIALKGYDGFLYSIGFLVAWLVALLLVAELLRNIGKYTMADVLQLPAAPATGPHRHGDLDARRVVLLPARPDGRCRWPRRPPARHRRAVGQRVVVGIVGVIMIIYVIIGGMKGTTWVQIIKAVLLIAGAGVMIIWVLSMFGFSLSNLIGAANETTASDLGTARDLTQPGLQYKNPIDFISLSMALVLGTAGLPHVLMRFYTVPTSSEARRSVVWAIWLIGLFYLFTLVLGFGAAEMLGPSEIKNAPGGANSAAPLLAFELGGEVFLGVISGVAFATILAVVAGLTITASATSRTTSTTRSSRREGHARGGGQGRPHRRRSSSAPSRSSAASSPRARTSRSSSPWPSPSRRARTCRRSSTRCSGSGSTPAARCGASTAAWSAP